MIKNSQSIFILKCQNLALYYTCCQKMTPSLTIVKFNIRSENNFFTQMLNFSIGANQFDICIEDVVI